MVRKKTEPNHLDTMLDDLLADCQGPEDILGEAGLLKQLSQRLVERALVGELNHHLAHDEPPPDANAERRNGVNVSFSLISEVTDAVSEDVKAWQCQPLDEVLPDSLC